jgi:hypothetical protein
MKGPFAMASNQHNKRRSRHLATWCCLLAALFCFCGPAHRARADENTPELPDQVTTSGSCSDVLAQNIPIADLGTELTPPLMGETKGWRRTQRYNTKSTDPDCYLPGHNGVDAGGEYGGSTDGVEQVHNVLQGTVLISTYIAGWGESVVVVSRLHPSSDELIMLVYHHLNKRFVGHCDDVLLGDLIGMEGKTGSSKWLIHLHFTVRYWANLEHLLHWLDQGVINVLGDDGYFGHDGLVFRGSYDPPYSDPSELMDEGSPYYAYGHLSPEDLLFNTFADYEALAAEPWSYGHARAMRKAGIMLGGWGGTFGILEHVKRREAARWIKIAIGLDRPTSAVQIFDDVLPDDPDFFYIQALTAYPPNVGPQNTVVNSLATFDPPSATFGPDREVARAEALKMTVMAFYADDFMGRLSEVWGMAIYDKLSAAPHFQDVELTDWYLPYVWYGAFFADEPDGLVAIKPQFDAAAPVTREEIAKWIMLGYERLHGPVPTLCNEVNPCPQGQHCDPDAVECVDNPECIPSETQQCESGGGQICELSTCTPGEQKVQACGLGGTQTAECNDQCQWGPWGDCAGGGTCTPGAQSGCGNCGITTRDATYTWGPCQGSGVCSPAAVEQQACNVVGSQTRTCLAGCAWAAWGACSAACIPNSVEQQGCSVDGQSGTQERTCTSQGQWGSWCACTPSCAATEYWSPVSISGVDNAGLQYLSGSPVTLDVGLEVQIEQKPGTWELRIRVCKLSGTLLNTVYLRFEEFITNWGLAMYDGSLAPSGTCSAWGEMSYESGFAEGDGLGGDWMIVSPASSSSEWSWTCAKNVTSPSGTCWTGPTGVMTRTCRQ